MGYCRSGLGLAPCMDVRGYMEIKPRSALERTEEVSGKRNVIVLPVELTGLTRSKNDNRHESFMEKPRASTMTRAFGSREAITTSRLKI